MRLPNIKRNTMFIVLEGIAAAVILNLYNPFIQIFAKRMGATDLHIAWINSLPQLVSIMILIPCGIMIERVKSKKLATCLIILVNSVFYAIIAFVPFLPNGIRLGAYILLIGLMNWPGSLYTTSWQSFFSSVYKDGDSGRVYSLRSFSGAFFGLVTVILTGLVLRYLPKSDSERILVYQMFYVLCFIISLFQALSLHKVRQAENTANKEDNCSPFKLGDFGIIFKNKTFMLYCTCVFIFHVSWQMGWPLFFIYNAEYVKADELQFAIISCAAGFMSFITYPLWNRFTDKMGNSFIIILGTFGLAINPILYVMTANFTIIIAVNALVGIAVAGFNLSLFGNLLDILPDGKRTVYIAVFNTCINFSGFMSPFLGVWLYKRTGMFSAMMLIGGFRIFATGLFVLRWVGMKKKEKLKIGFGRSTNI